MFFVIILKAKLDLLNSPSDKFDGELSNIPLYQT